MWDICLLYNLDAQPWAEYIFRYFAKTIPEVRSGFFVDTDLSKHYRFHELRDIFSNAKAVIVIISPGHVEFLKQYKHFSYTGLVENLTRAQLLLCGVRPEDLTNCLGESGGKVLPISARFPQFGRWIKTDHKNYRDLLSTTVTMIETRDAINPEEGMTEMSWKRHSRGVGNAGNCDLQMFPACAKCEEETLMTIIFDDALFNTSIDEAHSCDVILKDIKNPRSSPRIPAISVNPYTVQFVVPENQIGVYNMDLLLHGQTIGSTELVYQHSLDAEVVNGISQIYIQLFSKLFEYLHDRQLLTSGIDSVLSSLLDLDLMLKIPAKSFEQIFGIFAFLNTESCFEFPSLLHLAAKHNMTQFYSKLMDLPEATSASRIKNNTNHTADEILQETQQQRQQEENKEEVDRNKITGSDGRCSDEKCPNDGRCSDEKCSNDDGCSDDSSDDDDTFDRDDKQASMISHVNKGDYIDMDEVSKVRQMRLMSSFKSLPRVDTPPVDDVSDSRADVSPVSAMTVVHMTTRPSMLYTPGSEDLTVAHDQTGEFYDNILCSSESDDDDGYVKIPSRCASADDLNRSPPLHQRSHPQQPRQEQGQRQQEQEQGQQEQQEQFQQEHPRQLQQSSNETIHNLGSREDSLDSLSPVYTNTTHESGTGLENCSIPEHQRELIDILQQMKHKTLAANDGEYLFKEWQLKWFSQENKDSSKANKQKQDQLEKLREEIETGKKKKKARSFFSSLIHRKSSLKTMEKKILTPKRPRSNSIPVEMSQSGSGGKVEEAANVSVTAGARTLRFSRKITSGSWSEAPGPNSRFQICPTSSFSGDSQLVQLQRASDNSSSSHESFLSYASHTNSTSSGVDIDTLDEETASDFDPIYYNTWQRPIQHRKASLSIPYHDRSGSSKINPLPLPPRITSPLSSIYVPYVESGQAVRSPNSLTRSQSDDNVLNSFRDNPDETTFNPNDIFNTKDQTCVYELQRVEILAAEENDKLSNLSTARSKDERNLCSTRSNARSTSRSVKDAEIKCANSNARALFRSQSIDASGHSQQPKESHRSSHEISATDLDTSSTGQRNSNLAATSEICSTINTNLETSQTHHVHEKAIDSDPVALEFIARVGGDVDIGKETQLASWEGGGIHADSSSGRSSSVMDKDDMTHTYSTAFNEANATSPIYENAMSIMITADMTSELKCLISNDLSSDFVPDAKTSSLTKSNKSNCRLNPPHHLLLTDSYNPSGLTQLKVVVFPSPLDQVSVEKKFEDAQLNQLENIVDEGDPAGCSSSCTESRENQGPKVGSEVPEEKVEAAVQVSETTVAVARPRRTPPAVLPKTKRIKRRRSRSCGIPSVNDHDLPAPAALTSSASAKHLGLGEHGGREGKVKREIRRLSLLQDNKI